MQQRQMQQQQMQQMHMQQQQQMQRQRFQQQQEMQRQRQQQQFGVASQPAMVSMQRGLSFRRRRWAAAPTSAVRRRGRNEENGARAKKTVATPMHARPSEGMSGFVRVRRGTAEP